MTVANLQPKIESIEEEHHELKEQVMTLDSRTLLIQAQVNNIDKKVDTMLTWMGWFFKTVVGVVVTIGLGALAIEFGIGVQ